MSQAEFTLSLGLIAFMYIIFGIVRARARFRRTWHVKYDVGLVMIWGITAGAQYASTPEWRFSLRGIAVATLAMVAGHILYHLKFKPQQQEEA